VVERGYSRQFGTNEPSLLQDLVARGQARLTYGASGDGITVYDVTPFRDGAPAPASVKECGRL
jgi:hypothetical protein